MSDFFADLESHLLDAARRERRPRPRPRIVLAVVAAAAVVVLLLAVLPQSSQESGTVGGGPPAQLDDWTPYAPLPDCDGGLVTATEDPPPGVLRDAYELFRRPPSDPLPQEILETLARMGADEIREAAAREARGPDYSRVWIVPVGTVADPDDCDARSTPAVCLVASDASDPSCILERTFARTGFTRLFFDAARPPVVVGLAPDGVTAALLQVGADQVELPVRRNVFAATLAAPDVKLVEDLDVRWRYEDGRVIPAP
jgi:hypothetical protein